MAHAAGDALDTPLYGAHYRVIVPIFDADGDLVTAAAGLDSKVSKDCGDWVDCSNEATEINSGGMYYLDVTGAETTAKVVAIRVTTTSTGAKTTPIVFYPKRLPVLATGTAQDGSTSTITLTSGASAKDDFYNGCYVLITNNSPSGVQYQARRIIDYTGSSKVADIESAWGTTPNSTSTYSLLVPESTQVAGWAGKELAAYDTAGYPKVTVKAGTGIGEINMTAGVVDANLTQSAGVAVTSTAGRPEVNATHITGTAINTSLAQVGVNVVTAGAVSWTAGAISASAISTGAITSDKIATGAITALAIADGAIDSTTFASGAVTSTSLSTEALTAVADAFLNRDMSVGTDSGSATVRTPRQALRFLRNKWGLVDTTLTVRKEDDSTTSWTAEVTTSSTASPITGCDPASS